MVTMQKIEDEANAVIAETESVVSTALEAASPRWTKLVAAWKSWSMRKKLIAVTIAVVALVCAWEFSVDVGRLMLGSYRSAYSYGHGMNVTPDQVSDLSKRMDTLESDNHQMRIELSAVEDKLSNVDKKPAKITTGSIKHRHK